jgi:hypothetical protein
MSKATLDYFCNDELASSVWESKYKFQNEETPNDMFKRHVKEIAEIQAIQIRDNYVSIQKNLHLLSKHGKEYFSNLLEHYNSSFEDSQQYIEKYLFLCSFIFLFWNAAFQIFVI